MKRLIIIAIALIISFPIWGQEMERLSYTETVTIPGAQAEQLFDRVQEWRHVAAKPFNILTASYSTQDHLMDMEVDHLDIHLDNSTHSYDIIFHVFVSCQNEEYIVELTDIIGRVDGNTLSGYEFTDLRYDYMTQDSSGVRGGFYGWYWRKHDKRVRQWLENYFRQMADSLFSAMTSI